MTMADLMEAYDAIHVLRRFQDQHASRVDLGITVLSGERINAISCIHETIQGQFVEAWNKHRTPFLHNGKIVFWCQTAKTWKTVLAVDSTQITI